MSCLLLEDGLPETIDGVPIYADYRNMIRFEQILDDDALSPAVKTVLGVEQLFEELPPGGLERAVDRLQWFYSRGKSTDAEDKQPVGKKVVRAYDLTNDADASCIYAAFRQAYQIDLTEIPYLHWWAFLALLENLPDSTAMAQRMQLRTMDVSKVKDKKMREHYKALQKQVALPAKAAARPRKVESITIGAMNEVWSWQTSLVLQVVTGAALATALEFICGCIVNLWLGWDVWDYSNMPGNLMGQICPQYILLWAVLVLVAILLDDYIRWRFFGEEKPHYTV